MKGDGNRDVAYYVLASATIAITIISFRASHEFGFVLSGMGADLFLVSGWRSSFNFDDRTALNIMLFALLVAVPLQLYSFQYHVMWPGSVGSAATLAGAFLLMRRAKRISKQRSAAS